jgi:hypothetical protein
MTDNKNTTSFRLPPDRRRMIRELADRIGVSLTTVIVMAVREFYRREHRQQETQR